MMQISYLQANRNIQCGRKDYAENISIASKRRNDFVVQDFKILDGNAISLEFCTGCNGLCLGHKNGMILLFKVKEVLNSNSKRIYIHAPVVSMKYSYGLCFSFAWAKKEPGGIH